MITRFFKFDWLGRLIGCIPESCIELLMPSPLIPKYIWRKLLLEREESNPNLDKPSREREIENFLRELEQEMDLEARHDQGKA